VGREGGRRGHSIGGRCSRTKTKLRCMSGVRSSSIAGVRSHAERQRTLQGTRGTLWESSSVPNAMNGAPPLTRDEVLMCRFISAPRHGGGCCRVRRRWRRCTGGCPRGPEAAARREPWRRPGCPQGAVRVGGGRAEEDQRGIRGMHRLPDECGHEERAVGSERRIYVYSERDLA